MQWLLGRRARREKRRPTARQMLCAGAALTFCWWRTSPDAALLEASPCAWAAPGGPEARPQKALATRCRDSSLALQAREEEGLPSLEGWEPGPALILSAAARRAQAALRHDPLLLLFDATVKEELKTFAKRREQESRAVSSEPGALGEQQMLVSLRREIMLVKRRDRRQAVAELLYIMTCSRFKLLEVPLMKPLRLRQEQLSVSEDAQKVRLWGLTDLYSMEALELVRDHLFRMLQSSRRSVGEDGVVQLALFQAGQTYALSLMFGYYLRRVDARYQLEKMVGSLGFSRQRGGDGRSSEERGLHRKRPVPRWMDPEWTKGDLQAERSLSDYLESFGPEQLREIKTIASVESQVAMEVQVAALFGNLRDLKRQLLIAVGRVSSNEDLARKLAEAVESGNVESVRLSGRALQRLVLEAVAFGSLLRDAESEANTVYELTAHASGSGPTRIGFGDGPGSS